MGDFCRSIGGAVGDNAWLFRPLGGSREDNG